MLRTMRKGSHSSAEKPLGKGCNTENLGSPLGYVTFAARTPNERSRNTEREDIVSELGSSMTEAAAVVAANVVWKSEEETTRRTKRNLKKQKEFEVGWKVSVIPYDSHQVVVE